MFSRWFDDTFQSLRNPQYRTLWMGTTVAFLAFMMSSIVQSIVAFDLTGKNGAVGIVALGQGLMPAYAQELTIAERWAAVAYVRALSIQTQGTTLDRLPPAIRREAEEALQ